MIDRRITFEERYDSAEHGTTTLYFIAPKELLDGKYPEAESMEISVEFPTNQPEAKYATVEFSPTKWDEDGECYTDYDWFEVDVPYEEIEALIDLARKSKLFER